MRTSLAVVSACEVPGASLPVVGAAPVEPGSPAVELDPVVPGPVSPGAAGQPAHANASAPVMLHKSVMQRAMLRC